MWINAIVYFMKEVIGLTAVGLNVLGMVPYVISIYRGKTKPHLFSNLIWAIVTAIAFFGQVTKDAGPGAWTTGVATLFTIYTCFLAIKYGTKDVAKIDYIFLSLGLLSIIPWILTDDPTISVVMATFIDACGFAPTIRKTWNDPKSENLFSWVVNLIRHGLSMFAMRSFVLATFIYPLALLFMNIITILVILRNKIKPAKV